MPRIWDDVRVDEVATDELIRQLVATAGAMGEVVAVLEGDGPVIAEDWGGPHRDAFDADRAQIAESACSLAEQLLVAAAGAGAVLATGEGEQRLRNRLRSQLMADEVCRPGRAC